MQVRTEMKFDIVVLIAIILNVVFCENPRKVMSKITFQFGQAVLQCHKEVNVTDVVAGDFLQFWEKGHSIRNWETGCVFSCVLLRLRLLDMQGRLVEANAMAFSKANYADDRIAKKLVGMFKECQGSMASTNATITMEPCAFGLSLAMCFRNSVFRHRLEPRAGVVYDDDF